MMPNLKALATASKLFLHKRYRAPLLFAFLSLTLLSLWFYPAARPVSDGDREVTAVVTSVENQLQSFGMVSEGSQLVSALITEGSLKGRQIQGYNHIQGKLELDHIMHPGDSALFAVRLSSDGKISDSYVIGYARQNWEYALFALFILTLLLFAGSTGIKAFLSFLLTLLLLWKIFLPGLLKGYSPVPFALLILALICGVIIFLVLGINRKSLTAFGGAIAGLTMTTVFTLYFGEHMQLNGATAAFAESFLYSGS